MRPVPSLMPSGRVHAPTRACDFLDPQDCLGISLFSACYAAIFHSYRG